MKHISIKKLGLAFGLTGTLLYLGCAIVMLILGHDSTIIFFNSLLHGFDVSSIIRMNISLGEDLIGIVETFILCWLVGVCVAIMYNISFKNSNQ